MQNLIPIQCHHEGLGPQFIAHICSFDLDLVAKKREVKEGKAAVNLQTYTSRNRTSIGIQRIRNVCSFEGSRPIAMKIFCVQLAVRASVPSLRRVTVQAPAIKADRQFVQVSMKNDRTFASYTNFCSLVLLIAKRNRAFF